LAPLGGIVGCSTGGMLVAMGRRNFVFCIGIVMLFGIGITLTGYYWCLAVGRFFQGMCSGYYTFISPLYRILRIYTK